MIYTVTFSPAIDYVIDVDKLDLGEINRGYNEHVYAGGKGINVSIVLSNLGRESVATGFLGGFTGEFIKSELEKMNIKSKFIQIEGNTRINVKLKGFKETAINVSGPNIGNDKIEELIQYIETLKEDDLLCISGAIPKTLPDNMYELILERIKDKEITIVIDSTKQILLKTLKYHPLLVKPNQEELEEMLGVKIESKEDLVLNANKLLEMGAHNVIVSLGKDGALIVGEGIEPKFLKAPSIKPVVNTVGSGDSMVAGFIDEYINSKDVLRAFRKSVATGSATAFSEGLATKIEVDEILEKME